MAISYISSGSNYSTLGNSLNVSLGGIIENDVIIAVICVEDTTDKLYTIPSGFVEITDSTIGTRTHRQYTYYKVAGSSEGSSFTWGLVTSDEWTVSMSLFRGCDPSSPIGNTAVSTANASSVSAVAPSINIQMADNLSVVVASNMYGTTWSPPSGYFEAVDVRSSTGSGNISHSVHYKQASSGATGTITATSANADYWKAAHIELKQLYVETYNNGSYVIHVNGY